jgi:ATP-dependent RNA helicase DeaD
MTEGFGGLVGAELLGVVERLGYERPSAVQRAAIPVLRRGAHAVLHAARGAGATAAYGLAMIERLQELNEEAPGVHALVVTAAEERAEPVALELGQFGQPSGVTVSVLRPGWKADARIIVVPVQRVQQLLESSQLKLDDLKILVLHDVSAMLALNHQETLETLLPTVPRDAQRVLATSEMSTAVDKIADAHLRKALHIPVRAAVPEQPGGAGHAVVIEYHVASAETERHIVAETVAAASERCVVFCRTRAECERLGEELSLRGLAAETRTYGNPVQPGETAIGYAVPFDVETFNAAFAQGGTVVLPANQLTHLRNIATQAKAGLRAAAPAADSQATGLDRFRALLRRALEEEDVEAQLLVIEPLLSEYSAAEIAAAATALLRKRASVSEPRPSISASAGVPAAFAKLFLSVGQRDSISAREIVGTITGEAGVSGEQVGKVDIRDTFSIVEVAVDAAERVIRALNGTSLRGRSLRVDYDRKPVGTKRTMPTRRAPPRR